jgi:hypothetical protein
MRPEPGQVLHFSEDPTITRFAPHTAATAQQPEPYVWAVTWDRAPDYWFPRQCPRAMAWAGRKTSEQDAQRILGQAAHAQRVHAIEYAWLPAMRDVELYAYRFAEEDFRPFNDEASPHAMVSEREVTPLGKPERVGDLFALHDEAGIELRVLPELWRFWETVIGSSMEFSGIRLRNARGWERERG